MTTGVLANPLGNLAVSLHQTSTSPPTVRVSVANHNKHPVTILSYQSPLDKIALPLGLLSVSPAGASKPLDLPTIEVSREWPPPKEALIVVPPSESVTNDLVLQSPQVPMEMLGRKAAVALKGRWMAVWPRDRSELSDEEIDHSSRSASSGEFTTDDLEIIIG
ncbi:hypothetical protein DCS_01447 [Drechmeria coniospora]|uniref:Uncharacterized protein n=1 Tax=Drechmeria coniospora TaxID=98403 RepID=A0A151GTB0_DRECN|nr:hypothetical protein DCS_01447 [Drechmeria coniospora]KYK60310.1 hypothetical protein DCS_01447 [Drechmeria coniospora]ODA80251.1 hypothetical protein RJ55_03209 [Drechmeria coniospora]